MTETSSPVRPINQIRIDLFKEDSLIAYTNFVAPLCINPFKNLPKQLSCQSLLRIAQKALLIGHRGMGMNSDSKVLHLEENTMMSISLAYSLGSADYVEFDVQLTADKVPVIFHDWLISMKNNSVLPSCDNNYDIKTSAMIPIHLLSFDQFKRLGRIQTSKCGCAKNSAYFNDDMNIEFGSCRNKKFINDGFVSLAECMDRAPSKLNFNIEIKYPTNGEIFALPHHAQTISWPELNSYLDSILEVIFQKISEKTRNVILSTFSPDAAWILKYKQPFFPVLFLTEGGADDPEPIGFDPRRCDLDIAINWVRYCKLDGIVADSKAIFLKTIAEAVNSDDQQQNLAQVVHKLKSLATRPFMLLTYGSTHNTNLFDVNQQLEAGVDGIITDTLISIKSLFGKK